MEASTLLASALNRGNQVQGHRRTSKICEARGCMAVVGVWRKFRWQVLQPYAKADHSGRSELRQHGLFRSRTARRSFRPFLCGPSCLRSLFTSPSLTGGAWELGRSKLLLGHACRGANARAVHLCTKADLVHAPNDGSQLDGTIRARTRSFTLSRNRPQHARKSHPQPCGRKVNIILDLCVQ